MKEKILLIEDNEEIRCAIDSSLKKEGYKTISVATAEEGLLFLKKQEVNLILLDLMLPKMSGEAFLYHLGENNTVPIVVISAMNDEFTQIKLYNKKIEEYIVKPFSTNILALKIDAILRRTRANQEQEIVYEGLQLEINNYHAMINGKKLLLTSKEFEILQMMLLNQGKVFTREEFLDALWDFDTFIDPRAIDVHIKNIRSKIGKDVIQTVKGIGYRIEKKE
ncbi:response regulator transcription factor [Enterococcus casseliflavus]|nr:response regulator transcription factor [Enterococcus casseliflavus]